MAAEEEPLWVKREKERNLAAQGGGDLPFGVYLLASVIVCIAAVRAGSALSAAAVMLADLPSTKCAALNQCSDIMVPLRHALSCCLSCADRLYL